MEDEQIEYGFCHYPGCTRPLGDYVCLVDMADGETGGTCVLEFHPTCARNFALDVAREAQRGIDQARQGELGRVVNEKETAWGQRVGKTKRQWLKDEQRRVKREILGRALR